MQDGAIIAADRDEPAIVPREDESGRSANWYSFSLHISSILLISFVYLFAVMSRKGAKPGKLLN